MARKAERLEAALSPREGGPWKAVPWPEGKVVRGYSWKQLWWTLIKDGVEQDIMFTQDEARSAAAGLNAPAPCSVCCGKPLASGRKCICRGVGTERAENQGIRERLVHLEWALGCFTHLKPEASPAYEEVRAALSPREHDYWPIDRGRFCACCGYAKDSTTAKEPCGGEKNLYGVEAQSKAAQPVDEGEFPCGCRWWQDGDRCRDHMATDAGQGKYKDGGGPLSDLKLYTHPVGGGTVGWRNTSEQMPAEKLPVLVDGGIAMWRDGVWYTGMEEPWFQRPIEWTVRRWAPITAALNRLSADPQEKKDAI